MRPVIQRLAFALAACALGLLPVACSSGGGSVPSAVDGTRSTSSGGPANTGGGGGGSVPAPAPVPGGGGGGGGKALLPGAMAFSSGCGAINSVSNAATVTAGLPTVTITTKVAETNCVNIFFSEDYVNTSTGVTEFSTYCFNFTNTPYTCSIKDKSAQPGTVYQIVLKVWDATNAEGPFTPIDPAWMLATETITFTTAGAAPNQGA